MKMRDHISLNNWRLVLKMIQRFRHFLGMGLGSENNYEIGMTIQM